MRNVALSKVIPDRSTNADKAPLSANWRGVPVCNAPPRVISHSVSAVCKASSMSWVDMKMVFPPSWLRRISRSIVSTLLG